jgi:exonuclease SbcC
MRIKFLELQGFGPYLAKQTINFTQYDHEGLFIIVGETGAGKTSILDAITYALYGNTPRWEETTATLENRSFRSHFAKDSDPTKVTLSFEVNGQEYRVSRSPAYVLSTGKKVLDSAQLDKITPDEEPETLAMKSKNVGQKIYSLIKLSSDEFLQVILLAQGRFDIFLKANSSERMELLSKIFNTGRFKTLEDRIEYLKKDIEGELIDNRKGFTTTVDLIQKQLGADGPTQGEELNWVKKLLTRTKEQKSKAELSLDAASKAYEEAEAAKRTAEAQKQLGEYKAALSVAKSKSGQIQVLQKNLDLADSASRVQGIFKSRNDAQELVDTRTALLKESLAALVKNQVNPKVKGLDDSIVLLIDELGDLLGIEKGIPGMESTIASLNLQITEMKADLKRDTDNVSKASIRIAALQDKEDEYNSAKDIVEKNRQPLQQAEELAGFKEELKTAKADIGDLEQEVKKADSALKEAEEAERSSLASKLAITLINGEPCLVCGSTEHPKPHKGKANEPKSKDLAVLRNKLVDAQSNLNTQKKDIEKLNGKIKKMDESLEGISISALKKESNAAKKVIEAWPKLSKELRTLRELVKPDSKINKDIADYRSKLPKLILERDSTKEELEKAQESIANKLEGFKSINARKKKVEEDQKLLKAFRSLENDLATAKENLDASQRSLKEILTKESFANEEAFKKAVMSKDDYRKSKKDVSDHNDTITKLEGLLAQDSFKNLPTKTITLEKALSDFERAKSVKEVCSQKLADLNASEKTISTASKGLKEYATQIDKLSSKFAVHERLLNTIKGKSPNNLNMPLETFVLAGELEAILEAANYHLDKLSIGQYSFQYTEKSIQNAKARAGLGIEVMDAHTSRARDAHSLSGGERFLASISLALGLAEVVTSRAGGISIDTLFIDEGFGSLSSGPLDLVIETLDSLKQGGRTIGVISHGDTMKERIRSQLHVVKDPGGASKVL